MKMSHIMDGFQRHSSTQHKTKIAQQCGVADTLVSTYRNINISIEGIGRTTIGLLSPDLRALLFQQLMPSQAPGNFDIILKASHSPAICWKWCSLRRLVAFLVRSGGFSI